MIWTWVVNLLQEPIQKFSDYKQDAKFLEIF